MYRYNLWKALLVHKDILSFTIGFDTYAGISFGPETKQLRSTLKVQFMVQTQQFRLLTVITPIGMSEICVEYTTHKMTNTQLKLGNLSILL